MKDLRSDLAAKAAAPDLAGWLSREHGTFVLAEVSGALACARVLGRGSTPRRAEVAQGDVAAIESIVARLEA